MNNPQTLSMPGVKADAFAEPGLSPADFRQILNRRRWSLLLPSIGIILLSVLVALLLPPVYKSSSTILIEEQEIPADFVMTTVTSYVEQRLQSINQRIMSTTRLLEIIQRFDLYAEERDKKTTEEIVEIMREDVQLAPISTEVMDRRTGRATAATIAFTLSFEGQESPQTVLNVATQLASLFLEENLKVRERQAQETFQFLEDETQRVRTQLDAIEDKIATFKGQHINQLPELLQSNLQTLDLLERTIERYSEQLQTLKEREGYLQSQLAITSRDLEGNWAQKAQDRQKLELLEVELISLKTRYADAYPDVKRTRQEIDELRTRLDLPPFPTPIDANEENGESAENPAYVNLAAQLAGTTAEIDTIQHQIAKLEDRVADYRTRIENTPRVEETYNTLLSQRSNLQAKFNDLLQKSMEARVSQGLEKEQKGERFTLIDPARLPEKPFKPNRLAIALIGVVLGLGAGVGFAALREFTDTAVYDPETLSRQTGEGVLATIPIIVTEAEAALRQRMRWIKLGTAVVVLIAAPILFHFFVMDLDIFWAKLSRRIGI